MCVRVTSRRNIPRGSRNNCMPGIPEKSKSIRSIPEAILKEPILRGNPRDCGYILTSMMVREKGEVGGAHHLD